MTTHRQDGAQTRRMSAAEAFQTYPGLKSSIEKTLQLSDAYDIAGLTLELTDYGADGIYGTVHIPRIDPVLSTDIRLPVRISASPKQWKEPAEG